MIQILMNVSDLLSAITDRTIDCSAYPIIPREEYEFRMKLLRNRQQHLISVLHNNYWEYVSSLFYKLPMKYDHNKLLVLACKNINKHPDPSEAIMVFHYLAELKVILTHIMIAENNADYTIDYNYTEISNCQCSTPPREMRAELNVIEAFIAAL